MNVGVWLHDHFFRKHHGRPLHELLEGGSWAFLNVAKAREALPRIFADLADLGVECVDLSGGLGRSEEMTDELKARPPMPLTLHVEGDPKPELLLSPNPHTARAAKENLYRSLDFAAEVGAVTLTVHPVRFDERAAEIYRELSRYGNERGVTVALENCPYGRAGIDELLQYQKSFAPDTAKFTFDVGHCHIGYDAVAGYAALDGFVAHIHWHDNAGDRDAHVGPGMGTVDHRALMERVVRSPNAADINATLECDKPSVDYEAAFKNLKAMRDHALA